MRESYLLISKSSLVMMITSCRFRETYASDILDHDIGQTSIRLLLIMIQHFMIELKRQPRRQRIRLLIHLVRQLRTHINIRNPGLKPCHNLLIRLLLQINMQRKNNASLLHQVRHFEIMKKLQRPGRAFILVNKVKIQIPAINLSWVLYNNNSNEELSQESLRGGISAYDIVSEIVGFVEEAILLNIEISFFLTRE